MSKNRKQFFVFCALFSICSVLLISCSLGEKYDDNWMIGKTSAEIEEKYGSFDLASSNCKNFDGLYCDTGCGYLTKEGKVGFFGKSTDEFYMIYFDSNGVAFDIQKNYPRPGG